MTPSPVTMAPLLPVWFVLGLFALGLGASLIQFRSLRSRLGNRKALLLSGFRLAALSLLVSIILNPVRVTTTEHKLSPVVSILVDTSLSMGQPGRVGKGSRLEEAKSILTTGPNSLLGSLEEKFEVKVYSLGDSLRALERGELEGLKAGHSGGDLPEALRELGRKSTVAVFLSDGNARWADPDPSGLPVITVPLGNRQAYKDVLIEEIKAPTIGFRGREIVIDVRIKGYGYPGLTLPVTLKEGERPITTRHVRIDADPGQARASLSFVPEQAGERNLSVSIPQQVGEQLAQNNTSRFSVKVVRDKIRVLMVSGSPSMNYRFLRTALKSDPTIDLLSFVILRTPSDIMNVPQQEQSLIPFPVDTLFQKEVRSFDLLIFDNFPYSLYLRPYHLESIRDFVRAGGGLAVIGGPHFLDEGRSTGTAIGEVVPVRFKGREDYQRESPVRVKVSRTGIHHPILESSAGTRGDESDFLSLWRELPPLDGINLVEPKSSGVVLLEGAEEVPWPILTVSCYGDGRVLALATDYSWKWFTGMVAKGKGPQVYLRLVDRMVRWLTKDPGLDPIQVVFGENLRVTGEETEFRVKVREEDLPSHLRSAVSLVVLDPEGNKARATIKPAGPRGEYVARFFPRKEGVYRVRIETSAGTKEESILLQGPFEGMDLAPDPEKLQKIATSTGGKYVANKEELIRAISEYTAKGEGRFIEEKRSFLWATPYAMVLILGLLIPEWYFRRRWGLV